MRALRIGLLLTAWWFIGDHMVVGPFDDQAKCEEVRTAYWRIGHWDQPMYVYRIPPCWEAKSPR